MKKEQQNPEPEVLFEATEQQIEEARVKAKEFTLSELTKGKWRQKGNRVFTQAGSHEVGFFVRPGVILVGIDEKGLPVFEDTFKQIKQSV